MWWSSSSGRLDLRTNRVLQAVRCSTQVHLEVLRVHAWEKKMKNNSLEPPKLCALPPTEMAFRENVLRAHLAAATMKNSLSPDPPALLATEHGWYLAEGSQMLLPKIIPADTPVAPSALMKLIKCSCSSDRACATKRCSYRMHSLCCTFLCNCRGADLCNNYFTVWIIHMHYLYNK